MPLYNVSERTMTLLPELMHKAGIKNPVLYVEETKTLIRVYLLAHEEPVVIRKPAAKAKAKP